MQKYLDSTEVKEVMRFEAELSQYAASLNDEEKQIAGDILNDYLYRGRSLRYVLLAFTQLKGRSILKYRYLMFNRQFQAEIWEKYLWSVAEDLDIVLFNEYVTENDLHTIQRWIDVDDYNRNERAFLKMDWGNDERYRYDVTKYLFDILKDISDIDVHTIENIINTALENEEDY